MEIKMPKLGKGGLVEQGNTFIYDEDKLKERVVPLRDAKQEEIDKTIVSVCKWIQNNIDREFTTNDSPVIPQMINSLAVLISARQSAYPDFNDIKFDIDGLKIAEAINKINRGDK